MGKLRSGETLTLALVIPTLRESANLPKLLACTGDVLEACGVSYEVLVVDDDSQDGTEAVVAEASHANPRVRLLVRTGERGLAGAILHGWRHSSAEVLGVMDGDGQHPPAVLTSLLAAITEGHDLAIASRYADGGSSGGSNPLRLLLSKAAIWATRPLQPRGIRVSDPMSGFFLIRRRCIENAQFQPAGFKLLLEILARGQVQTAAEVGFTFLKRYEGRSKLGFKVSWDYLTLLARLYGARYSVKRVPQAATGD